MKMTWTCAFCGFTCTEELAERTLCRSCARVYVLIVAPESFVQAGQLRQPSQSRHPLAHGTLKGYQRGCRDICCRTAMRNYQREYRARDKAS